MNVGRLARPRGLAACPEQYLEPGIKGAGWSNWRTEPDCRRARGVRLERRRPGGERERDLALPAEPEGAALELDEVQVLDVTEVLLEPGDLVAQRGVCRAQLLGPVGCGRRLAD